MEAASTKPAAAAGSIVVDDDDHASEIELPEGIEANLFLDENLDDLPSDDDE